MLTHPASVITIEKKSAFMMEAEESKSIIYKKLICN